MSSSRGSIVDVLVVGAGPAGLTAAAAAAEQGKRVLVLDQGFRPGGQIWRHRDPEALPSMAREAMARARNAGATIASGARVVDVLSPGELVVDFRGRLDRQQTRALVIATGARERLMPFPGWTLPGVVGVGGLQALIKSGLSVSGAKIVIAGSGPLLFPVAATAAKAGADVLIVAEQASRGVLTGFGVTLLGKSAALWQGLRYRMAFRSTPYRTGSWVTGADGFGRVRRAILSVHGRRVEYDCDWLATGMGLVPSTELAQLIGCSLTATAITVDLSQATSVAGVWAAGECTGVKGDLAAMAEGEIAGRGAGGVASGGTIRRQRDAGRKFGQRLAKTFAPRAEVLALATAETILCRCEDVRRRDIDPEWTQRQAKLWTRIGMGECQGAVCGPACAALFGWDLNASRPPLGAPRVGEWGEALDTPSS